MEQSVITILHQDKPNEIRWVVDMTPKETSELLVNLYYREGLDPKGAVRGILTTKQYALGVAEDIHRMQEPTPARDLITLGEWLDSRGVTVNKSEKHKMANAMRNLYLKKYGIAPRVITRPDSKGNWQIKSKGYDPQDEDLFKQALRQVTGESRLDT